MLIAPVLVAGCSGNGSDDSSQSIVKPEEHLLSSVDIAKTDSGSPQRSFLIYWSALQYSAWSAALSYYEPGLAKVIGITQLVEALKAQGSYFRAAKPSLRGAIRIGDDVVVRYRIANFSGPPISTSITWRRVAGDWKIHYYPQLDSMLQFAAQTRVQNEIDPTASQPSKRALQAGQQAARLQSDYLRKDGP